MPFVCISFLYCVALYWYHTKERESIRPELSFPGAHKGLVWVLLVNWGLLGYAVCPATQLAVCAFHKMGDDVSK